MSWRSFSPAVPMWLALAGCLGPDFPSVEQSVCTVAGTGCRPECDATLMPSPFAAAEMPTYNLGPASCAVVALDAAARSAGRLCRKRGLALAAEPTAVTEAPPVTPLPPAAIATFHCERHG